MVRVRRPGPGPCASEPGRGCQCPEGPGAAGPSQVETAHARCSRGMIRVAGIRCSRAIRVNTSHRDGPETPRQRRLGFKFRLLLGRPPPIQRHAPAFKLGCVAAVLLGRHVRARDPTCAHTLTHTGPGVYEQSGRTVNVGRLRGSSTVLSGRSPRWNLNWHPKVPPLFSSPAVVSLVLDCGRGAEAPRFHNSMCSLAQARCSTSKALPKLEHPTVRSD
jgi:hypothetical protein